MADEDFLLALRLQEQWDSEISAPGWSEFHPVSKKRRVDSSGRDAGLYSRPVEPERPLSIVDKSWEMLDPNPDVRAMFLQFNTMFFWGKLSGVEVKWSPRMTLCAGVCSYEGRGGLCSIRLSEPLLKLRPRKDLVETLLHEMIHALLFVTQNNRDRDGHGPEFCKHMNRINQDSGTNISIYHSFHDEVDVYRQHWWRCDGPCQSRKPYFGYVKRAMNRAPSARDPWWEEHRRTCGGTYTKIKEPENYGKKGKSEEEKKEKNTSRKHGDKLKASSKGSQDIRNIIPFSGRGVVLGGSTQKLAFQSPTHSPKPLQEPDRTSPNQTLPDRTSPPQVSTPTALPKRSVSNHEAFVNINGSPVRVTKTNKSLVRPKQSTVQDLFRKGNLKSPKETIPTEPKVKTSPRSSRTSGSAGSPISKYFSSAKSVGSGFNPENGLPGSSGLFKTCKSSATGIFKSDSSSGSKSEPGVPKPYFGGTGTSSASSPSFFVKGAPRSSLGTKTHASSSIPGSHPRLLGSPEKRKSGSVIPDSTSRPGKRGREDENSAHMFDFFQRLSSPASSSLPREEKETGTEAEAPPGGGSTLLGSSGLTVICPVCQGKVLESQINQHLDSCLM
ncbi:DNA-dependent metalloprotease SPRTN [Silurus meridionalis]|uniref:DNA-dependent metalloprotease SPRTN n=1 Tax=Silurus meridionalis TaxID=175797 RepID=A0A8T0AQP3_SILME|nr:DNA-dependent metalloprotease SPRTN [Silurus meridionalis]KAF7694470.1 hypothetical protein HF521_008223 [Silurus meridionalis]